MCDAINDYMYKLIQTDYEIKILYKKHFKIDPNTLSPFSIYPEEEQMERYPENEQIEKYAQHLAFWGKLYEEYIDIDVLKQMMTPRGQYVHKKYYNMRMLAYDKFQHQPLVIEQIQRRVDELMNLTSKTV